MENIDKNPESKMVEMTEFNLPVEPISLLKTENSKSELYTIIRNEYKKWLKSGVNEYFITNEKEKTTQEPLVELTLRKLHILLRIKQKTKNTEFELDLTREVLTKNKSILDTDDVKGFWQKVDKVIKNTEQNKATLYKK